MLQQRLYYGLLKRGSLLDFKNTKAWHDPLFFILLLCFMHGVLHFALDILIKDGMGQVFVQESTTPAPGASVDEQAMSNRRQEMMHEAENAVKNFALPSMIFFAFLMASYDLEASLVSLSKYFEEDPKVARRAAGEMKVLDEDAVHQIIPHLSLKKSSADTSLDAVYSEILQLCPDKGCEPDAHTSVDWQIEKRVWPARILLDPRLKGAEAEQFRLLAIAVKFFSVLVMSGTFVYFSYQSWKDFGDVMEGQWEDGVSVVVLVWHAAIVAWILKVVFRSLLVLFERHN